VTYTNYTIIVDRKADLIAEQNSFLLGFSLLGGSSFHNFGQHRMRFPLC